MSKNKKGNPAEGYFKGIMDNFDAITVSGQTQDEPIPVPQPSAIKSEPAQPATPTDIPVIQQDAVEQPDVPSVNKAPATAPVHAKKEKAAPQKSPPKAKPGRTKKNSEPISNEDTTLVGIYLETDMHIWLKTYVIRTKSNVSKVVRRWAAAARYYSYQCTNPACQCEFMLDQAGSDDPQEPVACPVCQGKIAKAVKR